MPRMVCPTWLSRLPADTTLAKAGSLDNSCSCCFHLWRAQRVTAWQQRKTSLLCPDWRSKTTWYERKMWLFLQTTSWGRCSQIHSTVHSLLFIGEVDVGAKLDVSERPLPAPHHTNPGKERKGFNSKNKHGNTESWHWDKTQKTHLSDEAASASISFLFSFSSCHNKSMETFGKVLRIRSSTLCELSTKIGKIKSLQFSVPNSTK